MLRLLIGTGVLLMAVGFGAAGWQYYQTMPASPGDVAQPSDPAAPVPSQDWLISPSGGLVPQAEALAYLRQDRFHPDRSATILRTARLIELLTQGEKLPDEPYLQVLADIRAPKLAESMCKVLTDNLAAECAVNSARVVEGSVDPVQGTAQFRLELVYRLPPEAEPLPDLGAHVLSQTSTVVELDPGTEETRTVEAALSAALAQARAACPDNGLACRVQTLSVEWPPDAPVRLAARLAWLAPLPKGVIPAPPLESAPGG